MDTDQCDMFLLFCLLILIYWNSKVCEEVDSKHLALRTSRKESEPDLIAEEDRVIREKALRRKYKTIAEYRSKYHVSVSCAQDIIDSILKEGNKAQS
jgi:cell division protein FtsI/penicillin-binding protein 2